MSNPNRIPLDIVVDLVDRLVEERDGETRTGRKDGGVERLARETGIAHKSINTIRRRKYASVGFDTLDKILIGTENEHLWHTPISEGGFWEFYSYQEPKDDRKFRCKVCGREKRNISPICRACADVKKRGNGTGVRAPKYKKVPCNGCGKEIVVRPSGLCQPCWHKANKTKKHRDEYRDNIKHVIRRRMGGVAE
jgi:hypothetical protein